MKKLFTIIMLALLAVIIKPDTASASHLAGADITYTYTGNPNEYLVRLKLYRDCTGIPLGTTATVCYSSFSLGFAASIPLNEIAINNIGSATCVLTPTNACNTTPASDTEEHIYEGTITLPGAANDWRFEWNDCCRNPAITTLGNPGGEGMFVAASLDNLTAPTNSSPFFSTLAYTRFCVGNAFYYDQSAIDIDGDSLVFSLVNAEEDSTFDGCPTIEGSVQYAVNPATGTLYSGIEPFSSSIPITIDPNTGIVNFIPSLVQIGVMAIIVKEYRNGVQIGEVQRDIQINIISQCVQLTPSFLDAVVSTNGGSIQASCNDYSVIVPFDTLFQCGSAVPTDFRTIGPFGIPNPVVDVNPINCSGGKTDSMEVVFLNPLSVGTTKLFVKTGFDGNTLLSECGSSMAPGVDTINIVVTDNSLWSPVVDTLGCLFDEFVITLSDSVYCFSIANDGTDLQLVDGSGTSYPIANAYGYCNPSGLKTNQLLVEMAGNTSATGPLYLLLNNGGGSDGNTIANDCGRFLQATDTLAIFNIDNIIEVNLGSDQTICSFQTPFVLNSGYSGLTYQWSDLSGPIAGATFDTLQVSATGTYIVNLSSSPSCAGVDTIAITVIPSPIDNLPADYTQCSAEPFPLLDAGNPGSIYQWYLNGVAITGETSQTYQPTAGGIYSVTVDNGSATCIGTFDVIINTTAPYNVTLSNQNICENGALPILDAGNPGASSYQWYLDGTAIVGATSQTYQTTGEGTYSVQVGNGACGDSASMDLTITLLPTDNLPTDFSQCVLDPLPLLDAGNAGATYQWFLNGTAIAGATSQTYQPTVAGTYSVTIDNGVGCTNTFDVVITTIANYSVTLADQTICANTALPLLDAGNAGATSYQWFLNGVAITGANTQTYQTTGPGNYKVEVGLGTCKGVDSMDLVVVALPIVSLSNQNLCDVDPISPLDAGNAGATYQWFQNGTALSGETNQTYTPTTAGTYSVDVTVNPGCTSSATMQLTINATPVFSLSDASICVDGSATLDPGISGATYSWSTGATTQSISTNEDNTYILTVTQNGCSYRDTADVNVFDYPTAPVVGCVVTQSGTYKYIYSWAAITGAVSYEVSLDNGVTWIPSNQASGVETHGTNTSAPGFLVRAIGGGLCKIGDESLPTYCPISIPNIITPNGDGKNDFFLIDNIDQYSSNTVQIFSRWGKEVYSEDGYNNANKRFNGTDLPEGVYFYIINLNDGKEPRTGTLTINR